MENKNYNYKDFYKENIDNFKEQYFKRRKYFRTLFNADEQYNDELIIKDILGFIYCDKIKKINYDEIDTKQENDKIDVEAGIIKELKKFSQIEKVDKNYLDLLKEYCDENRYENIISYWLGLSIIQINHIILDIKKENLEDNKKVIEQLISFNILSKIQRENLEKQLRETEDALRIKEKEIIKPKGYNAFDLADYYIDCMHKARAKPSVRDLAKGSMYSKDKWNKNILRDYEFVSYLHTKLQKLANTEESKKRKYITAVLREIVLLYGKLYKKEIEKQNISNALQYNDNINQNSYEFEGIHYSKKKFVRNYDKD